MRFVCDSCRAQYMISDEKVGAKGVKVRCKKCGYVILVRRPDGAAPRAPAPAPAPAVGSVPTPAAGTDLAPAEGRAPTPAGETAPAPDLDGAPTSPTGMPAAASMGGAPTPPAGTALAALGANPMADTAAPWGGGAPSLDAEQVTSPSSASIEALAKAAEKAAAAGANGGLGGETPFDATLSDGPSNGAAASGSVFSGVQEDEIGAVFDQVLSSGLQKIEKPAINPLVPPPEKEELSLREDLQSTLVVSNDALKKLAEEAEAHASAEEAREQAKKNGAPAQDWFVAVDEQQVGPLGLEKVKDMWDRGEIGPDSLCWRAGMADWTPLSDVKELASELAPKPAKPVVASPATSVVGSVVTVPVESTFNSGGVARVVRTEVPMAAAAPDAAPDSGAWKPSAASALASLVSEEMSALAKKPKPRSLLESSGDHVALQAPAPAAKAPGLLDIPSAPADSGLNGKGMLNEVAPPAVIAPMAPASALAQPPNAPYAGPAVYGGQVPYPTYTSPLPRQGLSTTLKVAIGGAGALVLLLLVVVIILLARPAPVVVQQPPATAQRDELPMPPPPPGTTERPAAAATTPSAPTPTEPPPAAVAATPSAPTPTAPPSKPEPKGVEPVVAEREREPVPARRSRERVSSSRDEGEVVTPKKNNSESSGGGDDFDALFGDKKATEAPDGSRKRPYIPPAPGGGDVKEELSDADVMQVVVRNKSSIAGCKQGSGTITMQWTILTSGRTTGVSVLSDDFQGTSVGKCLAGVIKGWTFPRHRTQRPPIKFPFRF